MIREFEFFHGVVFTRILHILGKPMTIEFFPSSDNASYIINDKVGIYIKYSSKRLSPWRFSFQKRHQDEISDMKKLVDRVFLLLVCNDDGIVVLSFDELKKILDQTHNSVEWVSIIRRKREMYSVKGSDGSLEFKIGKDEFLKKMFDK